MNRETFPQINQTNYRATYRDNRTTHYDNSSYDTPVRSYSKGELSTMYNPNITSSAARKKLSQWMHHHPTLMQNLLDTGYNEMQRTFTPKQVRLIFDALGEP